MEKENTKYIFVSGGGISGLGKGIATASIGRVLSAAGFEVTALKIDPYFNIDPGTMNPTEHGEVFVLNDGSETDQDLGNYERFLNRDLNKDNYTTQGQIYQSVFYKERRGDYLGKTVELIPHVRDIVIDKILQAKHSSKAEIVMIELGGTVGEAQNFVFFRANSKLKRNFPSDVAHVHLGFIPTPRTIGEPKTKIAQTSIGSLEGMGIQPDILLARAEEKLDQRRIEKLADASDLRPEQIISAPDVGSIYDIPLNFENGGLTDELLKTLNLKRRQTDLNDWCAFVNKMRNAKQKIKIAMVGKYFKSGNGILTDAYISVYEAIKHACYNQGLKPEINAFNSEDIEGEVEMALRGQDGIIVPGGFGYRGVEGIIDTICLARENNVPFLGLCYGMQLAAVEYSRNVLGLMRANTTEIDVTTPHPVIDIMADQIQNMAEGNYGASMRLGAWKAKLNSRSQVAELYGGLEISERHRHRYELNNEYRNRLDSAGFKIVGASPKGELAEIIELNDHPFFIGTQFHPELKSRPLNPHPLFMGFIKAASQVSTP